MFIKNLLLLFMLLLVLSCQNTLTIPSGGGIGNENLTFNNIASKLLVSDDGSYVPSPYSDNGERYQDIFGSYTFVEEISETKRIYQKTLQNFYYGHEIKSGNLYVTDGIAGNVDSIDWRKAPKIGGFVNNYSGSFLNNAKGKKLSGCKRYFDGSTGRTYLGYGELISDKFNFVQALSATKAIYKNEKSSSFIGLSIANGSLDVTDENATSIKAINWDSYTNAGILK